MRAAIQTRRALLFVGLSSLGLSCTDVQVMNVESPGGTPSAFTGNIVGRVMPPASAARVIAAQVGPVDSTTIDAATGAFVLADLQPGTYDVIIRAEDYRIARLTQVGVFAGSVSYLGALTLSTTPDLVRSFGPADRSEVVLSGPGSRMAIGIDFEVPMDRASVVAAFSTTPPTAGVFYWSQQTPSIGSPYTGPWDASIAPPGYREAGGGEITTFRKVRSLRFIPRQRDTYVDTTYAVQLSTAAQDSAGEALRFPLRFTFRTIQSNATLTSIQTRPEDGAQEVGLQSYSSIRITFPKKMDRPSVENALTIAPGNAPIFLWPADNELLLYTGGPLRASATYTVRIEASARDLDGRPLGEPFEFSFETEAVALRHTTPSNGQVFVDFSTNLYIALWFNTYIVRSTLQSAWSIVPPVSGQFDWMSDTAVAFRPAAPLLPNTKYTVRIEGVRDLHGSTLANPYAFAFVTRPQ